MADNVTKPVETDKPVNPAKPVEIDKVAHYATGTEDLCKLVLKAREESGRPAVAAHLGQNLSTIWRWERNKVQTIELPKFKRLVATLDKLDARKPVGLMSRIDAARKLVAATDMDATAKRQLLALLSR